MGRQQEPVQNGREIKTIPLVYRAPKQPLVDELNQKLIDHASSWIKNEYIYKPEFKPKFSCKSLPSKSASYDGVEFVLVIAECLSSNEPDQKEPRKFSELFASDDSKIWSLDFNMGRTSAEVTIFNVFNDYSFLLKNPAGDGGPGCDSVYIREKKGVWKQVEPACEPRGC